MDSHLGTWHAGNERLISTSVQAQIASGRLRPHSEVAMCTKLREHGRTTDALDALNLVLQRGCHVPKKLFYLVLKRCIADKNLALGRRIHALTIISGYGGDSFLATHLMGLYAAHGRLEDAMRVFSEVPIPSAYNWATIIFAYARHGDAAQAIVLYRQLRLSTVEPDNRIYLGVLKACAAASDLLAGYSQQGKGHEALTLYNSMLQEGLSPPNSVTFICLLQACASVGVGALHQGKQLHAQIEKRALQEVLSGSLVNMYAKCGSLEDARCMFDKLVQKDVVTWNAIIAGYVQQGMGQEAIRLHSKMQQEAITAPDSVTFVCLLQACASIGPGALHQGKHLHSQIVERGLQDDLVLGGSLTNMYVKCGSTGDARRLFDQLQRRNVVTWTAMIAGYAKQGMCQEALSLYDSMQQEGSTPPNSVTVVCLLRACAIVAALPLGRQLHAHIKERGLQADVVVGTELVNMYAKCGSMFDSQQVFDSLPERPIEAWGALTDGYTRQGDSKAVFDLLDKMKLEGVEPDGIMFLCVLTVCSHVGLVEKGRNYFEAMSADFGISPTIEHYTCIMDLLGRAGHLNEALSMAKSMPFPPDSVMWLALLAACRTWNNVEIGQWAFEFAVSVDGEDAASYMLMSSIYASAEMWEEARKVEVRRVKSGAWKIRGQSWWTDMGGGVHKFVVGDVSHPESEARLGPESRKCATLSLAVCNSPGDERMLKCARNWL